MNHSSIYPFAAIVGQEKMKLALVLNVINPGLSGVLIRGEKGTGKSTAVRALAHILPEISAIDGLPIDLDPETELSFFERLSSIMPCSTSLSSNPPDVISKRIRVVEMPVGATEDRVVGTLDIEYALKTGNRRMEPGILARAHRHILYVDEVNLLDDHIVDILLDAAAMGTNTIEREGISLSHPARFTLVGTMNPEEGELRPQLLDRFGLCVTVKGAQTIEERIEIMERRVAFELDPCGFIKRWQQETRELTKRIQEARQRYTKVEADTDMLESIARLCIEAEVDGHRADIVMLKCARTLAAWHGRNRITEDDITQAAEFVLPHRSRRLPMMEVAQSLEEVLGKGPHRAGGLSA